MQSVQGLGFQTFLVDTFFQLTYVTLVEFYQCINLIPKSIFEDGESYLIVWSTNIEPIIRHDNYYRDVCDTRKVGSLCTRNQDNLTTGPSKSALIAICGLIWSCAVFRD